MARKIRRRRDRRNTALRPLTMALLMIVAFAAVAVMMQDPQGRTQPRMEPDGALPTSSIETISDMLQLDAQDYYAIQFGVYENSAAAQEQAQTYVSRGAAGYVWEQAGKYRVLAAVYTSLDDAQTIKERLREQQIEATIFAIHQPALKMRMSAGDAQRALLAEVFSFIPQSIREIGDISIALDKRTMQPQEAAQRMQTLGAQAQAYCNGMQARLGRDENGVIEGIEALMHVLAEDCEEIFSQNPQEELAMTAKIKYNYLEVLWNAGQFVENVLAFHAA